ncbi:hypothetical protein OIDMADRAFT_16918 [Oidiodendron maius Zn]|uniref:Uncharacterized protein n=1 Tax=Oidiodendron maius (strain Zn) TaxID=913774 RepID=A0A0C3HTU9_OIDMZ|nr:hypothetical protein OIDMADRAFT_16918 [Oidiodendron maius Zn]
MSRPAPKANIRNVSEDHWPASNNPKNNEATREREREKKVCMSHSQLAFWKARWHSDGGMNPPSLFQSFHASHAAVRRLTVGANHPGWGPALGQSCHESAQSLLWLY